MEKRKLLEEIDRIEKELVVLQDKYDKLKISVHKSSMFNFAEAKHELKVIERELKQKKLILKEYKERNRS